jgi:hypothetical protein
MPVAVEIEECHTPGCSHEAVSSNAFPDSRLWCPGCQVRLDRCRDEMQDRSWKQSHHNKDGVNERYCVTPGCSHRPVYGGEFCAECSGEG